MNRYNNGTSNHSVGMGGYGRQPRDESLSKTNVFIRGLPATTNDQDLFDMCNKFGPIQSAKSITDRMTNECKGYGFVNFENPNDATNAVRELTNCGYQARMSKENMGRNDRPSFGSSRIQDYRVRTNGGPNSRYTNGLRPLSKTNLYLRGLDVHTSDNDLHALCTR